MNRVTIILLMVPVTGLTKISGRAKWFVTYAGSYLEGVHDLYIAQISSDTGEILMLGSVEKSGVLLYFTGSEDHENSGAPN